MPAIHYQITDDLHRRAKIAAVKQGQTLKQFVEDALTAHVEAVEAKARKDSKR